VLVEVRGYNPRVFRVVRSEFTSVNAIRPELSMLLILRLFRNFFIQFTNKNFTAKFSQSQVMRSFLILMFMNDGL
jgi:hypothetical protein